MAKRRVFSTAASIPLRSDFDRLHREARTPKHGASEPNAGAGDDR